MLVKKITYTDFDGVERTEEHMFHLTKAEVTKFLTTHGDYTLDKLVLQIAKAHDGKTIMDMFEDLIKKAYGKKSVDGRRFEKSEEIWNDFYQTEAYSTLFMEIVTDADKAVEFLNGIMPNDLTMDIEKTIRENPDAIPEEMKDYVRPLLAGKEPTMTVVK